MAEITVRKAREDDLGAVVDITNHCIRTSACTLKGREELPEALVESFRLRGEGYPLLVAERGNEVVGWEDLTPHSERSAYRFTVHDAVSVRYDLRGQEIGTAILASARELGYRSVVAVITASQTPSLDPHRGLGFIDAGRLRQAGFKLGRWEDVVTLQLML
jgi:L-amino acid N-acyltransferase